MNFRGIISFEVSSHGSSYSFDVSMELCIKVRSKPHNKVSVKHHMRESLIKLNIKVCVKTLNPPVYWLYLHEFSQVHPIYINKYRSLGRASCTHASNGTGDE